LRFRLPECKDMKTLEKPFAVGRTAEVYAWEEGTVLKLYRDWCPASWVEREAHIARVVEQAGIPAPKPGEIVEVGGRRGILYERVDGPSMLKAMNQNPLKLIFFARMLARLHVEMHQCSAADSNLPSQRASALLAIQHAGALGDDLRQKALQALETLPDGDRLCHGDFHPDNVLLTSRGPVIIDWMTAVQGHPAADVARTRLLLSLGDPPPGSAFSLRLILLGRSLYVRSYLRYHQDRSPETVRLSSAYLPVMAAARLNEEIAPEREKLLKLVGLLSSSGES